MCVEQEELPGRLPASLCTTRYGVEQRESLALTACVDIAASSLLFFDYNLLFFSALRKKVDDTGAELGNDNNGG